MFEKIFFFLKNNQKQLFRYFITGSSAFVLDFATLLFLKESLSLHPALAVALNQILVLNYVFLMNKHWSFGSKGEVKTQMLRFFILMSWNYVFSVSWIWIWVEWLDFSFYLPWFSQNIGYLIGRLVSILIQVSWNFLLYKHWIYKNALK